jgi:hypothetical protein
MRDSALTKTLFGLGYVCIGSNSLVLPIDKHPQTDLILLVTELLGDTGLELEIGFSLENPERSKLGRRPILVLE